MNDTVKYLGSLFGIEKKIQLTSGSGVYYVLKPLAHIKYSKRILKIALKCPVSSACVEEANHVNKNIEEFSSAE